MKTATNHTANLVPKKILSELTAIAIATIAIEEDKYPLKAGYAKFPNFEPVPYIPLQYRPPIFHLKIKI